MLFDPCTECGQSGLSGERFHQKIFPESQSYPAYQDFVPDESHQAEFLLTSLHIAKAAFGNTDNFCDLSLRQIVMFTRSTQMSADSAVVDFHIVSPP